MLVIVAVAVVVIVVIVVMVMLVIVAIAVAVVIIMVMVVMMLMLHLLKLMLCCRALIHRGEELLAREPVPIGCNDRGGRVYRAQKLDTLRDPVLACIARMAEDDATCLGDLIVKKFAEILHIHLAFVDICNGRERTELHFVGQDALSSTNHVGELANARRLDDDPIGMVGLYRFSQRLGEVADKATADAARVHLGDVDARVLEEASVNAYLTEFILDEHELFADIALRDHFFDERGLSCSQKS